MLSVVDLEGGRVGECLITGMTGDWKIGKTEVVDVGPGRRVADLTVALLVTVFPEHVLAEGFRFFKGDETLHAHKILVVGGAMGVQ